MIDLRSDTVTRPSKAMMEAMMNARVGDDVFYEDPTATELEEFTASLFGKEAAIYCPSGTMTNQIAIKLHTRPGDEIICDKTAHVYNYEGGGIAVHSGCTARLIDGDRGRFTSEQVLMAINPPMDNMTRTRLVCIENTSNKGGGSYWKMEEIKKIRAVCDKHNLKLHLDGARLFNALVETDEAATEHGKIFDSISICLSKGLGAPVGSLLTGERDFIREARRKRRLMGGGMRQAGIIAAAGLFALKNNISRLKEDHQRAIELQQTLSGQWYVKELLPVDSNIIVFTLSDKVNPSMFLSYLQDKGVRAVPFGYQTIRFVTHLDFTDEMLNKVKIILSTIDERNFREKEILA